MFSFSDKTGTVCTKELETVIGVTFGDYKKFEDLREIPNLKQYSRLETRVDPLVIRSNEEYTCKTFWPLNGECLFEIKVSIKVYNQQ